MLLCLDIGNTQIHGGVFDGDNLRCQFRKSTHPLGSSDELGVFFIAALRENGVDPRGVDRVALCSVVPPALHALRSAALKYFRHEPFVLQAGVKTGLRVRYRNPLEVGADRIANAIAATQRHPNRDLLVVDCGTATTLDVVTATGDYLGGAILPGVGLSADTLAQRTARLPAVEIVRPISALGRTTVESILAGLYHGHIGAIRHLTDELAGEAFAGARPHVIGTGGFARMFERDGLFDEVEPELVLWGLKRAEELNREDAPPRS
ncbi:MAG: pantothenate kinase [Verrucomicrobia bacterium RIFCSPLOWO2_12_FULL_64_8]|nr:MAG: pantothenate kinase [Verrucomicrobia bacterium RIFCSPLOWO2_12_FULL_64_8]